jgi:hypothetical protein
MKKFIIAAAAALVATVSMAATAEAGWKWKHPHHGWHHGHHWGVVVVNPGWGYDDDDDYCYFKKIKHYDDWGNVYIKKVRICG